MAMDPVDPLVSILHSDNDLPVCVDMDVYLVIPDSPVEEPSTWTQLSLHLFGAALYDEQNRLL